MARAFYIAAPMGEKKRAAELAQKLLSWGGAIASSWHDEPDVAEADLTELARQRIVRSLMSDVLSCDLLIALLDAGCPRGTFVEMGMALAFSRPVLLVPSPDPDARCIFDAHPLVMRFASEAQLVALLERDLDAERELRCSMHGAAVLEVNAMSE